MKPVLVFASLSLLSMCAFAADPAAAPAAACAVPVIPAVSTSTVGVQRVDKAIKQWDDCVAKQETDENMRRDDEVKAKANAWLAATIQYSNGQAQGGAVVARVEQDKRELVLSATDLERIRFASLNKKGM